MTRIAGVVVLYHPDKEVIQNINSYINDIDILYYLDNSNKKDKKLISEIKAIKKVVYIDNRGNKGIAYAQNRAAHIAIKERYEWLLTMDQDSAATENMVGLLVKYIEQHDTSNIGIVTAFQEYKNKNYFSQEYQQVVVAMSSGNILNLKVYKVVGGFLNKLFIDMVDNEYCLRLNQHGYKVIMVNKAILKHNVGETKIIDNIIFNSYNPYRLYYYVRNNLFTEREYADIFPGLMKERKEFTRKKYIKIILYEKNRISNVYYMLRGFIDYKRNRYGELK